MKTRIINLYEKLRSSYWFIPSVMAIGSIVLAVLLVDLDQMNRRERLIDLSWINLTGGAGARAILSTVASSMITVTGIVFSINIVTLSLASQQFGPRLLQNFMRDRGNQFVLGTVTSTYLYCLLVLRAVSEDGRTQFVPHLSILVAVALATLCVGVLIYFIHHVAESIQVTNVIAAVSRELTACIERLFPEKAAPPDETGKALAELLPPRFDERVRPLPALASGYLQAVDQAGLLALAEEQDLVVRIRHRSGDFLFAGAPLVEVWPGESAASQDLVTEMNDHFITGSKRSREQDLEFLVNELVEIAARALSPGINDPFTALSCINHLGLALCELAPRTAPAVLKKDRDGRVRVISSPSTFEQTVDAAFGPIRQYGRSHTSITVRLLETIRVVIPFTGTPQQREALLRQAAMIERGSHAALPEEADRRQVHEQYLAIFQSLEDRFGLTGGA